jgi:hypothetical protein
MLGGPQGHTYDRDGEWRETDNKPQMMLKIVSKGEQSSFHVPIDQDCPVDFGKIWHV